MHVTFSIRFILFVLWVACICFGADDLRSDDATTNNPTLNSTEHLKLGDEAFVRNDVESAIKYYEQGIRALAQDIPLTTALELYTNLGSAKSHSGDDESAIGAYRRAILLHTEAIESIAGDDDAKRDATNLAAQAAYYLGMVHQNSGDMEKSADAYSLANTLDPLHWASVANLGAVLHDNMNQFADALAAYNKAYEILTQKDVQATDPPEDLNVVLSQIQYRTGLAIHMGMEGRRCALHTDPAKSVPCEEMAAHSFSLSVQYDGSNEKAKHMLAAITADGTMSRATNEYVTQLFEDYASNFEQSLVDELGYNGFERLRRGFDRAFGSNSEDTPYFDMVIDAGCGTGLAGEQFRNISKSLIGVDLSPSIVEEAKTSRPGLYDELVVGDVIESFRHRKPIDLIVAADSYIYFGDLVPVFEAMQEGLRDGGYVAFTLENASEESEKNLDEAKPEWRWQLTPSGRFAHRKQYVESVASTHSMEVVRYETLDDFRHERGEGVRGHMFVLKKVGRDKEL
mmetsp:Transcript_19778/g.40166  ORF Transcript_19778/g.40166 Transcript_19778/m.40166 type:complete len:513 (-) Transcript_19778:652-2190(-)